MKLLDVLITTCELEEYAKQIKDNEIDIYTFKILNDEDLKLLGIDDEQKRKKIIEYAANLQIPCEKVPKFNVNEEYLKIILSQMCLQLTRHLAILSIHLNRNDIVVCDVKLNPPAVSLYNNIKSLSNKLKLFEEQMIVSQKKVPQRGRKFIMSGILTLICLSIIKIYIK